MRSFGTNGFLETAGIFRRGITLHNFVLGSQLTVAVAHTREVSSRGAEGLAWYSAEEGRALSVGHRDRKTERKRKEGRKMPSSEVQPAGVQLRRRKVSRSNDLSRFLTNKKQK